MLSRIVVIVGLALRVTAQGGASVTDVGIVPQPTIPFPGLATTCAPGMNCGTAILWVNKPVYTLEPETVIEWSTTTELTEFIETFTTVTASVSVVEESAITGQCISTNTIVIPERPTVTFTFPTTTTEFKILTKTTTSLKVYTETVVKPPRCIIPGISIPEFPAYPKDPARICSTSTAPPPGSPSTPPTPPDDDDDDDDRYRGGYPET